MGGDASSGPPRAFFVPPRRAHGHEQGKLRVPPSHSVHRHNLGHSETAVPPPDVTQVHSPPMSLPDELEKLVGAGLVTSDQADSARRVDDDIAATAIGKLVCIGLDARALLPGYAQAFGMTLASDEALARSTRPPLSQQMVDALAALSAAPTWGGDGSIEIVVTAARTVPELATLGLPPHRVLVGDEPRVMALLDRVLAGEPTPAPPPAAARREASGSSPKAERFLARPVREIDRRAQGLNDPSASSLVIEPFGAPTGGPMNAPSAGVDAPFASAPNPFAPNPFADVVPSAGPRGAVPNPFANDAPAPFPAAAPSAPSAPSASSALSASSASSASLEIAAPAPKRPSSGSSGASGPHAAAPREPSREVARPEPKRGPPIAAIAIGVVVVVALAVGVVMVMRNQTESPTGPTASADRRSAALDEARGKERAGDFAWAIAGYTRAVDDARRDDDTADALLGRARCNIALGDREEALRDIDQVTSGTFASPSMKQKAEALRASLQ